MKRVLTLIALGCLGVGGWWLWNNGDQLQKMVGDYVVNGEILTLEARFTAEQLMDTHRKELLVDNQHTYQEPTLKFYPYLLMEVKYTQDKKTKEGVVLWSLVDGEMVLNTETWEKTHGFEDAIDAKASKNDFRVLNALAKKNGTMTVDELQKELHVESDALEPWVASALDKHLIIKKGNQLKLHFQNPKILVTPQTKMNQHPVTKPYNHAQTVSKKFGRSQIENVATAAFGSDFTIRKSYEVFLPVYSIEVLNPDGSVLTTYWNALNGKRIVPKYLAQSP